LIIIKNNKIYKFCWN